MFNFFVRLTENFGRAGKGDGFVSLSGGGVMNGPGGNPRYHPDPSSGGALTPTMMGAMTPTATMGVGGMGGRRPPYTSQQHGVDVIRSNSGQGEERVMYNSSVQCTHRTVALCVQFYTVHYLFLL